MNEGSRPSAEPGKLRAIRIVHFSDTHLGHQQYARLTAEGLNQREADHAAAFDAVLDHAIQSKADLVLHAGDLFDGVRPSNRALAVALRGFWRLSRAGIPAVVIAGNHEHPKLRDTGSPLALFTDIPGLHVAYKGQPETYALAIGGQALRVHAVPQMASQEDLGLAIQALVRGPAAGPGRDLLVVHGSVTTIDIGHHGEFNELSLDPAWFAGFDHVALGHFHRQQQAAGNAWYSGATERASMAESGEAKGFLEVTLPAQGPVAVTPVTLPCRPYVDLPPIEAEGLDAAAVLAAAKAAIARCPAGAVVRQRMLDVDAHLRAGLDLRSLQEFARERGLLHLDLSRIEWTDTRHDVRGDAAFGALGPEFESFAATVPLPGLDRAKLLALAKGVLEATP